MLYDSTPRQAYWRWFRNKKGFDLNISDLAIYAFFNIALRQTSNLKEGFLLARSLVSKRELRQGFEPSHPQMAGGGNVEPLLMARR